MKPKLHIPFAILILIAAILATYHFFLPAIVPTETRRFDGKRALVDIEYQLSLGARVPGSKAHQKVQDWIASELQKSGWQVDFQKTEIMGQSVSNIVARRGSGSPWLILGAHYDSRQLADHDPNPHKRTLPVPGANDGASGVAVLLELSRTLPAQTGKEVWLVFFDAEDQGNIPGWDWILGSRAFARDLQGNPDAVVIVDMVGDRDLDLYLEHNSSTALAQKIWELAGELGYGDLFIPEYKYTILDDHIPFIEKGIPAVDIIDFDYPYWHTTEDTIDKVSAESLQVVGETLWAWIMRE